MENRSFDYYCRVPGTRCNAIMTMLERGYSDEVVAMKFKTDTPTISVYRKALEGKLTETDDITDVMDRRVPSVGRRKQTKRRLAKAFKSASRVPFYRDKYDVDRESFASLIMTLTGTNTVTAAGYKLIGDGHTAREIYYKGYLTARRLADIADITGINLYELGIAKRREPDADHD